MIILTFRCQGRVLTYGPGIHDELTNIAKSVQDNTGMALEHWDQTGEQYTMWFIPTKLVELLLTKGDSGMDILRTGSGMIGHAAVLGLRDVRFFKEI